MESCRLCLDVGANAPSEKWNEPIFESPNFVALVSLGALVEGWTLVVPKKHFICLGAIPDLLIDEMREVKSALYSALRQSYGRVCAFEHGPSRPNCNLGCGVDHAHLHMVPLDFDLIAAVTPFLPENTLWCDADADECRSSFRRGEDYLYLEQPEGCTRIATHQSFASQLFRRAIALKVGRPAQFNWREYPQIPTVNATLDKLRVCVGSGLSYQDQPEIAA